jgi:hypothetical protein
MVAREMRAETLRTMEAEVEDDGGQPDHVMQRRLESATALDRNQFTLVGRALQKHSNRSHSHFSILPGGQRASAYNSAGVRQLTEILMHPSNTIERDHPVLGPIVDIYHEDGRGARFHRDAHAFIGLLERSRRTS